MEKERKSTDSGKSSPLCRHNDNFFSVCVDYLEKNACEDKSLQELTWLRVACRETYMVNLGVPHKKILAQLNFLIT